MFTPIMRLSQDEALDVYSGDLPTLTSSRRFVVPRCTGAREYGARIRLVRNWDYPKVFV